MINKPTAKEYAPYYETYISLVKSPLEQMTNQADFLNSYIEENEDRLDYAYAEGKWSIRQVIMHVVDTEHIFVYRMLRIARGDKTALSGFDQDVLIDNTDFTHLDAGDLIRAVENQRAHTFSVINSFTTDKLTLTGTASDQEVSVRALIYMITGHMQHHINILNDRYIKS